MTGSEDGKLFNASATPSGNEGRYCVRLQGKNHTGEAHRIGKLPATRIGTGPRLEAELELIRRAID